MAVAVLATACGGGGDPIAARPQVVATTTVLGDVVRTIAGPDADVEVLLPLDADPHDFQPSAQQIAAVSGADLVIAVGLGLEEGLEDALESAAADGVAVVTIADRVDPRPFLDGEGLDPHVWLDPVRMADAARLIGAELEALAPGGEFAERAEDYAATLVDLDAGIRELFEVVPPERRKVVTNHDSLGYFADRYGLEIVGTVIPGGSTLAEPSSAELAELVDTIRRTGVAAIFAETTEPTALAEAVAGELGGEVAVIQLFVGSLGPPGSGAETLFDMLRVNALLVAAALA